MMLSIREIKLDELGCLPEMLYQAVFQPEGQEPYSPDIIYLPEIYQYIQHFGQKKDDYCLVAEAEENIIGAVWVRVLSGKIKGYGNIDDETPEFAISLFKPYRNQGIGTKLMLAMIDYLKKKGYKQTSLSVQKENYASKMYQKLGFQIVDENEEDYIMVLKLS